MGTAATPARSARCGTGVLEPGGPSRFVRLQSVALSCLMLRSLHSDGTCRQVAGSRTSETRMDALFVRDGGTGTRRAL
jgi:hypothetical protein